jgi:DNA-binding NarL/FixJ family response regulator
MSASQTKRIRLLLVDDHAVVREGIRSFLVAQPHLEIVGEASDGREALAKAQELVPDIVLMDITMPHQNGLETARLLSQQVPQTRVLVLTVHNNQEYAAQVIRCGARGYLLKDTSPAELVRAIEAVHAGQAFFSPLISQAMMNDLVAKAAQPVSAVTQSLTAREQEVLIHIASGLSNKEIAERLQLGLRTIETHRERIMRKLDIHNVAGLTRFAITEGLINLNKDKPASDTR